MVVYDEASGGGGLYNEGTLTLNSCTVSDNSSAATTAYGSAYGGGIFSRSTLTLKSTTVSRNACTISGSPSWNWSLSGDCIGGGIYSQDGVATLDNCSVTGNSTVGSAGEIGSSGTLTINNCTVSGNSASAVNNYTVGGGIYSSGTMMLSNSTISDNSVVAIGPFNQGGSAQGGGIFIEYGLFTINNCTISGNIVNGTWGDGLFGDLSATYGAVVQSREGTGTMKNCTVTGNWKEGSSNIDGAVGISGSVDLQNCIVAGNGQDLFLNPFDYTGGETTSSGHNLIGSANEDWVNTHAQSSDLVGTWDTPPLEPLLGPLQDNGGPTFTHALLPGSPAINFGDNTGAGNAGLTTDQRGLPRFVGAVDIGAFEDQTQPNTAPLVSCPAPATVSCTSTAGRSVSVNATVNDPDSGQTLTVTLKEAAAVLDTQIVSTPGNNAPVTFAPVTLSPGTHTLSIAVTDGTDSASCNTSVSVTYNWTGAFLSPAPKQQYLAGSTIPIKFKLTGDSAGINNLVATGSWTLLTGGNPGTYTPIGTFKYDPANSIYLLNWSTKKGSAKGTYRIKAELNDGVSRTMDVVLK